MYVPEDHPVAGTLKKAKQRGRAKCYSLRNSEAWKPGDTELCTDVFVLDPESPIAVEYLERFDPEVLGEGSLYAGFKLHVLRPRVQKDAGRSAIDLDEEVRQDEAVAKYLGLNKPISKEGKDALRQAKAKAAKRKGPKDKL